MSTAVADPAAEALDALRALVSAEVSHAERPELAELVRAARTVRGFVDAFDVAIARRSRQLAERDHPRPQPAPDAAPPRPGPDRSDGEVVALFLSSGGRSGRDAKAAGAREAVCAALPCFEEALAAGEISGAHVDALVRVWRGLTEVERAELRARADELVRLARGEFAEGFEKSLRAVVGAIRAQHRPNSEADELVRQRQASKVSTWVDGDTGMCKTLIELDPLRNDELHRAIDAHLARLKAAPQDRSATLQSLKVNALMAAVTTPGAAAADGASADDGGSKGSASKGLVRVPKFVVVIDVRSLLSGPHTGTISELPNGTPVPVSVVQQYLCEADLVPVWLSGEGQPLAVGDTRRLATAAQRDALAAIYGGCGEIGCGCGFDDTHIHHTRSWREHFETNLEDLVPLCPRGHQRVHHDGWTVEVLDNHRAIRWTRPDGTVVYEGPPPNRRQPRTTAA